MDLETAAQQSFASDDALPWEHLGGPEKAYLLTHFDQAREIIDSPGNSPSERST
jgi:hypothetical protein